MTAGWWRPEIGAAEWWRDEIGARTLTAERRNGPWREFVPDCDEPIDREGDYWTVIDRDTGGQMGSFGLPVEMATKEAALEEARRFGSKWGWAAVDPETGETQ